MDVRRQSARVIKRSNPYKPDKLSHAAGHSQVIAPDSDLAIRAAGDSLIRATWRRHFDIHDISLETMYTVRFDQSVYGESRSVLALAPTAVAAVNNEWPRLHSKSHVAAGAAAIVNVGLI